MGRCRVTAGAGTSTRQNVVPGAPEPEASTAFAASILEPTGDEPMVDALESPASPAPGGNGQWALVPTSSWAVVSPPRTLWRLKSFSHLYLITALLITTSAGVLAVFLLACQAAFWADPHPRNGDALNPLEQWHGHATTLMLLGDLTNSCIQEAAEAFCTRPSTSCLEGCDQTADKGRTLCSDHNGRRIVRRPPDVVFFTSTLDAAIAYCSTRRWRCAYGAHFERPSSVLLQRFEGKSLPAVKHTLDTHMQTELHGPLWTMVCSQSAGGRTCAARGNGSAGAEAAAPCDVDARLRHLSVVSVDGSCDESVRLLRSTLESMGMASHLELPHAEHAGKTEPQLIRPLTPPSVASLAPGVFLSDAPVLHHLGSSPGAVQAGPRAMGADEHQDAAVSKEALATLLAADQLFQKRLDRYLVCEDQIYEDARRAHRLLTGNMHRLD